jgi:hypothetical protein
MNKTKIDESSGTKKEKVYYNIYNKIKSERSYTAIVD